MYSDGDFQCAFKICDRHVYEAIRAKMCMVYYGTIKCSQKHKMYTQEQRCF